MKYPFFFIPFLSLTLHAFAADPQFRVEEPSAYFPGGTEVRVGSINVETGNYRSSYLFGPNTFRVEVSLHCEDTFFWTHGLMSGDDYKFRGATILHLSKPIQVNPGAKFSYASLSTAEGLVFDSPALNRAAAKLGGVCSWYSVEVNVLAVGSLGQTETTLSSKISIVDNRGAYNRYQKGNGVWYLNPNLYDTAKGMRLEGLVLSNYAPNWEEPHSDSFYDGYTNEQLFRQKVK